MSRILIQEEMDALVVAEHLVKIRDVALEYLRWDSTNDTINAIYGLTIQVLFSAERLVTYYEEKDGTD